MLQVLLFYGHDPGVWLCRTPQPANFSAHMAAAGFETGVRLYVCMN